MLICTSPVARASGWGISLHADALGAIRQ